MPLPSSEIPSDSLYKIEDVLAVYDHLLTNKPSAPGTLAQTLARMAVFGERIMGHCTPTGTRSLRALPQKELMQIKVIIFQYYPNLWRSPEGFETIWCTCQTAMEQCCGRLRREAKKERVVITCTYMYLNVLEYIHVHVYTHLYSPWPPLTCTCVKVRIIILASFPGSLPLRIFTCVQYFQRMTTEPARSMGLWV